MLLSCLVLIIGLAIQCQAQPGFGDPRGAENVLNNLMGGPGGLPPDPLLGPLAEGPGPGFVPMVGPSMGPDPAMMSGNGRPPGLYDYPISDIRRMLDGMERGMFYDTRNGQMVMDPAAQPIFTRDELLRELDRRNARGDRQDQPSSGGSGGSVTIEFTRPDVERMRTGMLEGKRYNYQGKEAISGETTLTMEQLDQLMAQFEPVKQTTAEFTLEQVQNMIRGTQNGRKFNYQGNLARPSQPTLTMDQLNQLLAMLQPQELPKFSLAQIENMLAGIRAGRSYNYQGVIASAGERTITTNQLIELRTKLQQTDSRPSSPFTLALVLSMLEGMQQGKRYNYQGKLASAGEPTLTLQQLEQLRSQFRTTETSRSTPFTLEQVQAMIAGTKDGRIFNYQGNFASEGEPTLSMEQLERLRIQLLQSAQIMDGRFKLQHVLNMIEGVKLGLEYNFKGNLASSEERLLTLDLLYKFRSQLELRAPDLQGPFNTAQFTLDKINSMIDGMNQGNFYNYQGNIASAGELRLTMQQLTELRSKAQEKAESMSTTQFNLEQIQGMIEGINRGPIDINSASFTLEQVQTMLNGMNRGLKYNYQGFVASDGQPTLSRTLLERLLIRLQSQGQMMSVPFTMPQVLEMMEGMQSGARYNYDGMMAGQGQEALTLSQLLYLYNLLLNNPGAAMPVRRGARPDFNLADIRTMIRGYEMGNMYNFGGRRAQLGDRTLSMRHLMLLQQEYENQGFMNDGSTGRPANLDQGSFPPNDLSGGGQKDGMGSQPKNDVMNPNTNVSPVVGDSTLTGASGGGTSMTQPNTDPMLSIVDLSPPGGDTSIGGSSMGSPGTNQGGDPNYTPDMGTSGSNLPDGNMHGGSTGGSDMSLGGNVGDILSPPSGGVGDMSGGTGNNLLLSPVGSDTSLGSSRNDILPGQGGGREEAFTGTGNEIITSAGPDSSLGGNIPDNRRPGSENNLLSSGTGVSPVSNTLSRGPESLFDTTGNEIVRSPGPDTTGNDLVIDTGASSGPTSTSGSDNLLSSGSDMLPGSPASDFMPSGGSTGNDVPGGRSDSPMGGGGSDGAGSLQGFPPNIGAIPDIGPSGEIINQPGSNVLSGDMGPGADMRTGDSGTLPGTTLLDPGMIDTPNVIDGGNSNQGTGNIGSGTVDNPNIIDRGNTNQGTGTPGSGPTAPIVDNVGGDQGMDMRPSGSGSSFPGDGMGPAGGDMGLNPSGTSFPGDGMGPSGGDMGLNPSGTSFPGDGMGPSGGDMGLNPSDSRFPGDGMGPAGGDMGLNPSGSSFPGDGMGPSGGDMGLNPSGSSFPGDGMGPSGGDMGLNPSGTSFPGDGMGPSGGDMGLNPSGSSFPGDGMGPSGGDMGLNPSGSSFPGDGMGPAGGDMGLNPSETIDPSGSVKPISGGAGNADNAIPPGSSVVDINPLPAGSPDLNPNQPLGPDRFTIPKIQSMLEGMRSRNKAYNRFGNEAAPGEQTLSEQYLEGELIRLQPLPSEPIQFTLPKIQSMLDDMRTGNTAYNYLGDNAMPGQQTLTEQYLMGELKKLQPMPSQPIEFDLPKIQSMLDAMNTGNMAYNYLGDEAMPGQQTLSRNYLEGELRKLQPLPNQPIKFDLRKIQSMLDGMRTGNMAYNYLGDEAMPGQQTLSQTYLEEEMRKLQPMPNQPMYFDLPKIQSMLDGMRTRNMAYNYLGDEAMPGQQTLSLNYLEGELRKLQPMPSKPVDFDLPKIHSMLDGMRTGNMAYNYLGDEAMPGQQTLSLDYLEGELRKLKPMPSQPIDFDLPKIQSMLDGMRTGNMAYNYLGDEAMPGQQTLSMNYLEGELRKLQPMPSQPIDFDLPKIQSMLDGMRTGNMAYNYLGDQAMPGQQTLSMNYLEGELRKLQPLPTQPINFDLPKIQSMLDGMRTGNMAYNYLGDEAMPGQQTLSMNYLEGELRKLQPLPSQPIYFDLPKIQSMLDGMRTRNMAYNYLGDEAMPGQQTLSLDYLEGELRKLQPIQSMLDGMRTRNMAYNYFMPGQQTLSRDYLEGELRKLQPMPSQPIYFDLPKIQSMLDGMRTRNMAYNYLGDEAMPGQQTLSLDYLEGELRKLQPMPSQPIYFDLPKIQSMLDGMRTRNMAYNYLGDEAMPGQQTLSLDYLEGELRKLQPMPSQPKYFDLPKIQSMLDGMRTRNMAYNYLGDEAMPGQQTLSLDYLEGELRKLQPMPSQPIYFDLPKIQSMLDGMRTRNMAYNYLGDEAMPGQQTLSLDYLEGELRKLQPMPSQPKYFDLPKVQSMLDGMRTRNMAYNYLGDEAMPGQQTLSLDYLEGELRKLQPMPNTPIDFDLPKIQSMLDGMRKGNMAYNYVGDVAKPGQQILSMPYLEEELRRLQPMPASPIMFDLPKIKSMLDGMRNRNEAYNFLGDKAMPGQQTISLPYLEGELQRLQPMPTAPTSFTLEKLQGMLDGMNADGNMAYNYLGDPAMPGQQTITREYLEKEKDRLQPLAMPAKFSLPRLLSLLDGLRRGDVYNYMGGPATAGQKRLTIPYLEREIQKMRAMERPQPDPIDKLPYEQPPSRPRFTTEQVRNMINGMTINGKKYNEGGFEAQPGDKTYTLDYLERMLRRLQEIARPSWMKARIDPAQCRKYKCDIPICYLPDDDDCKSYIVCQRTALGTYVAWKMRCAFGSFWSKSKYTCQKVEEFVDVGQKCLKKDKCRDPSLKRYPDKEEKNCRTFWRCERGVSIPDCCPRGQMFDRKLMQCVNDPLEHCRSPCPLRREGCGYSFAKKEPLYDGNCRTFWDCEKNNPHPVCCPAGHSYNTRDRTCDQDNSCRDTCPGQYAKSCATLGRKNQVITYGLDDDNCRTFMKCYGPQFGEPRCCPQQHRYNSSSGQCDRVFDYLDDCNYQTCPGYKEECRFKAIPDNPKMYWDAEAQREQPCAPGTEFIEFLCTCNGTVRNSKCKTLVHAKFDRPEKWLVKNYGDGWISQYGGFHKNRTRNQLTYGTFDGTGGIEVWRFDHDRFEAAYLKIIFQPLSVGAKRQILMSNCRSITGDQPSFEVSLDINRNMTVFEGRTDYNSTILEVPYDPQEWNTYEIIFDGKHVAAMIKGDASNVAEYTDSAQLLGDTVTGVGSMKFGPCTDGPYQGLNNGFVGYISEIEFAKCLTKENKNRLMQVVR